jgi:hypothetical protein
VFIELDADIKRPAWLVCSLAHRLPFYTIDYMRFRSSKRPQSEAAEGECHRRPPRPWNQEC